MKNRRPNNKAILVFLLCIIAHSVQLYAEDVRLLLLASEIQNSTQGELERRIQTLGLTPAGGLSELREQLYNHHGIVDTTLTVGDIAQKTGYVLEIIQAQRLMAKQSGDNITSVLLEGLVKIRFRSSPDQSPQELEAARVLIDLDGHQLHAIGSVVFRDAQGTLLEKVEGEVITFDWIDNDIMISKGTTSMVRENSEEAKVEFLTSGEKVTFLGDGGSVRFDKGFITTNLKNAYFSISAEKLLLIKGGDMFVEQAWISIGRVPLLWIPFLYYPGQTFIFNPAFGYDQDRGFFFSTTTELYGNYGKIEKSDESSFTTLLSSAENGIRVRDGWTYKTVDSQDKEQSSVGLSEWASKTDSYLVLFGDTYQHRGTFLGLDTMNNFSDGRYKLSITSGIAFWGNHAVASSVYDIPAIRYYIDSRFTMKTKGSDLSITIPYYSDPKVRIDYGNRLTSFSIGGLLGNQDFPDVFRSDITNFTWVLDGSITIPVDFLQPYVDFFKINQINARVVWKAKPLTAGAGPGYQISSMVVPDLRASAAGTLISWHKAIGEMPVEPLSTPPEDPQPLSTSAMNSLNSWDFKEIGIDPPYTAPAVSISSKATSTTQSHFLELSYSAEQLLANSYQFQNQIAIEDSIYAKSQVFLILKASIAPKILDFDTQIAPLFTFNSNAASSSSRFQLLSDTKITIPYIGLTYALSARLYTLGIEKTDGGSDIISESWGAWDEDTITTHRIVVSRPISLGAATVTPSLTSVLPPLAISVTPRLQFKQGNFNSLVGYKFVEKTGGGFKGEMLSLSASYDDNRTLSLSWNSTYDTSGFSIPGTLFTWDPFSASGTATLRLFEKKLSLIQKFDYKANSNTFDSLESTIRTPWLTATFKSAGEIGSLEPLGLTLTTQVKDLTFSWWKNRINLGLELSTSFYYSFQDASATNLQLTAGMRFNIAEFLDLKVSLTSVNKGFSTYASFSDMMDDLFQSFDFFGNGRYSTQFNMESVSLELTHYMDDWDLHCKYTGSVVLSNMEWLWKPVFIVFLQWKSIPEIKVDRRFDL